MENSTIVRYNPNIRNGLNEEQLSERKSSHLINYDTTVPTKSVKQILRDNIVTLFNLINLFLGITIFCVGSYKNLLFLVIIICNTAISTIQELHSRNVVNKLSIIAQSKVTAIRNGIKKKISINDIVLDDILEFHSGDQIVTDSIIQDGEVQVDESFITGEPDAVFKGIGDTILSGSFIVSGYAAAKVEHIGDDNYTSKISSNAKYIKKVNSEIMYSLNKIIKILSFAIIPIGLLMFFSHTDLPMQEAVVKTVAAIIGMIPEGLVLLTSTVLAVSVIRLSKSKVLVQDIYCIETLARVDTLCLDKTGTLTEGILEVKKLLPLPNNNTDNIKNILANISASSTDINSTINAVRNEYSKITEKYKPLKVVPFSSQTKWSGINFEDIGTYIIGAPEFILKENFEIYSQYINSYIDDYRVIVLAHSENNFIEKELPLIIQPIAFILISDKIRKEASKTLKYFKEQGVDIKIISGDNPKTVSKIAKRTGIESYEKYIDTSTLKTEDDIKNAVDKYTVFGRVAPHQKKSLITALKENGRTVAMTGDGVNDVLALKESDCSIAIAGGSDACKSVSMLVLLDSNFASMPKVVAEGRRTINNIQRSASLFLTKTIYSALLAVLFLILPEAYPFMPIQLSLISTVTIGLPSFILALEPNLEKLKGHFFRNVIARALPSSLTAVLNIFVITMLKRFGYVTGESYTTICVISMGIVGIILLFILSKKRKSEQSRLPVSLFRFALALCSLFLFIAGLIILQDLFSLVITENLFIDIIKVTLMSIINFTIFNLFLRKILKFT